MMKNMCKRFFKRFRPVLSLAICLGLLVRVSPSAAAADGDYTMSVTWSVMGTRYQVEQMAAYGRNDYVDQVELIYPSSGVYGYVNIGDVHISSEQWLSGAIGLYVSYYFGATQPETVFEAATPVMELYYINDLGQEGVGSTEVTTFTPVTSALVYTPGYSVKASTVADAAHPVSDVGFRFSYSNIRVYPYQASTGYVRLYIPSITVVATPVSEDLAALEGVADAIAEQSQIMSAMYADMMQVLNAIYSRT